ncbi:MAG: sugar phosphate isomerase/epimerase [Verrucomicrobiota bacterium]|nr:sugar phosphate isomerase/epimerase [Verrucomicrobiota bacterium]
MKRLLFSFASISLALVPMRAVELSGSFQGPIGLQLYSLRDSFKTDVPGTLDKVKGFGFTTVETAGTYGLPVEEFRKQLDARGLKVVSAHIGYEALKTSLDGAIREAKALGATYIACAWIPHEIGNFNEADVKRASADFNLWGEKLKAAGLTFAYHCHGYEFRPVSEGASETLFDLLARGTKPELVAFEMDVFWVVQPGADPVKLLAKYSGRWQLMHVKDLRKGARTGVYTGKAASLADDVAIGTGVVDWPAVLKEAARVGVKHYFIEDESPMVLEQIPVSLKYLSKVRY